MSLSSRNPHGQDYAKRGIDLHTRFSAARLIYPSSYKISHKRVVAKSHGHMDLGIWMMGEYQVSIKFLVRANNGLTKAYLTPNFITIS